jgi:outer membrane protein TolC
MNIDKNLLLLCLLLCPLSSYAQLPLSLQEAVAMAREQSIAAYQADTRRENSFWQWKTFTSDYKPQLRLEGILPNFNRSFVPVTQPNGSIAFQSVSNNSLSATLSLSQQVAATGGTLFISSQLQRFDDLERDFTSYNGNPVFFGFEQPLFGFNALKWNKLIEPIRFRESQQRYVEELENISVRAVELYFDLLLAQVNRQIATSNLANNDTIYRIGKERFALGDIAKNELIQLQLGVLNTEKSLMSAQQSLAAAEFALKAFIGLQTEQELLLQIPEQTPALSIATSRALEVAFENHQSAISLERQLREAERNIARAKGENGLNVQLVATLGLTNRADVVPEIYSNPQNQQSVFLQFGIPITDWGRQESRRKQAEANLKLAQFTNQQEKLNFEQTIRTQIGLFGTYSAQLELTKLTDQLSQERYQISQERYILGNISITNLTIALIEKDQARRDYIQALRNYWFTFYNIRRMSLYDFKNDTVISDTL